MKNRVIKNHIKWGKKRTSILLIITGNIMICIMAAVVGYTWPWYLPNSTVTMAQEKSEPTRTCYFMSIKFVGSDQNGAELEVIEIPAGCPPIQACENEELECGESYDPELFEPERNPR